MLQHQLMIEEESSMMQDALQKKIWKHNSNTKKKQSVRSLEDDTAQTDQEMQNPKLGSGENKRKKKKGHFASLGECDISEIATVDIEQDLNSQLFVDNSKKKLKKKKKDQSASLGQCDISELVTIDTEQVLHSPLFVASSGKKQKKKKKDQSASLGQCDISESVTIDTEQVLHSPLFVASSGKKQKKKKKDQSASLGQCDISELITVDTEQDLNLQLSMDNNEKKRKKKKDQSASLGKCDISEIVTVDAEQVLHSQLLVDKSEKKQKKKKKDHSAFLGECDISETVTVNTEHDLPFVGSSEKKQKKRKKERISSGSAEECDDSEVQNPRESDQSESKPKKKKKKRSISLEVLCDGSETATVTSEQDLQNVQFVRNNGKKWKKKKKERHNSRSEEEYDVSDTPNLQLLGNGEREKEKHHPRSLERDVTTQVSSTDIKNEAQCFELTDCGGNQTNKRTHHCCSAGETSVSVPAIKTKQTLQSARLMDSGDKKKDHVKAVKNGVEVTTTETPQAVQNPKLVGGRNGHEKKRKRCSNPAEEGGGKYHSKSEESVNDSETPAKIPLQKSAMSKSVDIDTETSAKKYKRTKKIIQFENSINKDASLNDSEIPQKSIKKCKLSSVLPFENSSAGLLQITDSTFKKHTVKCSAGGLAEKEATDHTNAVDIGDFAEITAEQTSIDCQGAVKTPKRYKQKKGTLSGHKRSGRTKNLKRDTPSALSIESTLEVVITPQTIADPNKRKKNKQRQHKTGSNNKVSITAVGRSPKEKIPFGQDETKVKMFDKSKLIELLKDFIPNVENLTSETMYNMYKYDLPRFERFKEEGIPIRRGRFTQEENQQLQKNLKVFMDLTGVENEWELLHVPESANEMIRMKRLKQNNLFCCRLAEDIPRPWKSVYQRAKKMYDPNRCKGRYTKDELKKLQCLQVLHGNSWKKIAELMDRSDLSVMCRARTIKSSLNVGPWSEEEKTTFMKIMEVVMKNRIQEASHDLTSTLSNTNRLHSILREELYKDIPWSAIADQMENRNWAQCRQKWMQILITKMTGGVDPSEFNGYRAKISLIKRLYLLRVDDVNDVDWEDLCSVVGDVPPLFIQRMFYRLKNRYVPEWSRKSFGEIVDFLYEHIIPNLEAMLEKQVGPDDWIGADDLCRPQQREFKLIDIFDEEDEIEKMQAQGKLAGTLAANSSWRNDLKM